MALRVLCIDDDVRLYELLAAYFQPNGVTLAHAADGARGLAALAAGVFDAVLLDVMMPGMDGLEVCRRLRQVSQVPVIMLTARGDEADRVVGLELGADDYVPKPFSPRELLARLRAVLRRAQPAAAGTEIVIGQVAIDVAARRVRVGADPVELTGLEFDILVALARRPGRVVPRETLLVEAGRPDVTVSDRTVDVHVSHLRRKLGDDSKTPRLIKTVRGVGYVLAPGAELEPASSPASSPLPSPPLASAPPAGTASLPAQPPSVPPAGAASSPDPLPSSRPAGPSSGERR